MNGFERLQTMVKDQEDTALKQTVEYLLSRKDMEQNYLNEEKTLEGMCSFICEKGNKYKKNGWNYVQDEVVYAWAIMYFALPNSFLKIKSKPKKDTKKDDKLISPVPQKNNVITIEKAKEKVTQLSLFGGVTQ